MSTALILGRFGGQSLGGTHTHTHTHTHPPTMLRGVRWCSLLDCDSVPSLVVMSPKNASIDKSAYSCASDSTDPTANETCVGV